MGWSRKGEVEGNWEICGDGTGRMVTYVSGMVSTLR